MSKRHYLLLAIILAFFSVTMIIGSSQEVWTDEGYSLLTTSHALKDIPKIALKFELQPPIYFVLLKIWRFCSSSVLWLRIFSILVACCSILVFEKLTRFYTDKYVLVITALFAFNPATIWAALEIRSYSLMLLMALSLLFLFYKYYLSSEPPVLRQRFYYSLLALISVWVNYYLVLLLISNFIILLFAQNRKVSIKYLIDMVIPALGTLIFLPFFSNQYHSYTRGIERITSIKEIFKFIFLRYEEYLFTPRLFVIYIRYILRILFFLLIALKIRKLIVIPNKQVRFLVYHIFVMTVILAIMVPFVNLSMIKYRHTLFVFPILLIAFFIMILQYKKVYASLIFLLLGCLYAINTGIFYYYSSDVSGVVSSTKIVEKDETSNQDIVIYRNELELVFNYYYHGKNKILAIPYIIDVNRPYNHELWNIESSADVKSFFNSKPVTEKFWLLTDTFYTNIFGTDYNYDTLDNYINRNYITNFDSIFADGIRLRSISQLKNYSKEAKLINE